MYRASLCSHCHQAPAARTCDACGLWMCDGCVCAADRSAWTGRCRDCGDLFPDEQRRDVLDDGDGEVCCPRCGWTRRLRRLELVDDPQAAELRAASPCSSCGCLFDDANLVLHVPTDRQMLYHLLCACGRTLASATSPH